MEGDTGGPSKNVINFLNAEFDDISNLKNAKNILEKNIKRVNNIQSKIALSSEIVPSELSDISITSERTVKKATELSEHVEQLRMESQQHIAKMKSLKDKFAMPLCEIQELQNAQCYLEWVMKLENISKLIETALQQGVEHSAVAHYCEFKEMWNHLQMSQCTHLVNFAKKTIFYWHDVLKERFGSNFDKILASLHWPVSSSTVLSPPSEITSKFKILFTYLWEIQLPDSLTKENANDESGFQPPILPLQLMLKPLQKRFIFHFMTKKQTNRLEKPEWYLTQILMWIRDHSELMHRLVQPLLNDLGLEKTFAKVELMKGLVQLATKRLESDMPDLVYDDHLLTHTIDEVLLFEKELYNQGYPMTLHSTINILSTDMCFSRWRRLEHKSAVEKMDQLLNSPTAWKLCYEDEELDELKVPECAETFMTLLLTMTERYQNLPKSIHRISFLELQLELLDDFRLRLHQLLHSEASEPLQSNFCSILNAIHYVIVILTEWSNLPFFQHMQQIKRHCHEILESDNIPNVCSEHREGNPRLNNLNSLLPDEVTLPDDDELLKSTVFDDAISLLEHMKSDMLHTLLDRVLMDVKAKSRPYRKEKWFCMPRQENLELSRLAYPLLSVLKTHLQKLQETLAKSLFIFSWQYIAKEVNLYIYEEVILQNFFSEGGAAQLNCDMTRNLFPIFGEYTQRPESYFKELKESCILLTLSFGATILLKETLSSAVDGHEALEELGIFSFTPAASLNILSLKSDLPSS